MILEVMLGGQMKTDLQDISATNAQRSILVLQE